MIKLNALYTWKNLKQGLNHRLDLKKFHKVLNGFKVWVFFGKNIKKKALVPSW